MPRVERALYGEFANLRGLYSVFKRTRVSGKDGLGFGLNPRVKWREDGLAETLLHTTLRAGYLVNVTITHLGLNYILTSNIYSLLIHV